MKMTRTLTRLCVVLFAAVSGSLLHAQEVMDYTSSRELTIESIEVTSNSEKVDVQAVILLSGLRKGDKIKVPGDDINEAIQNLWKERVFSNIKIYALKIESGKIWLEIYVEERPRLSKYKFFGTRKGEEDDLRQILDLYRSMIITEYSLKNIEYRVKEFYGEKGFLNTEVTFEERPDTSFLANSIILDIRVNKNEKVKVGRLNISGNKHILTSKIRRQFKDALVEKSRFDVFHDALNLLKGKPPMREVDSTVMHMDLYQAAIEYFRNAARVNIFKSSKYVKEEVESAKNNVIALFNAKGYRDAYFVKDSIYLKDGEILADFEISEGRQYFFRNITWVGNKLYRSGQLDTLLSIKRGDIYDQDKLDKQLRYSPTGLDISSLYQDIGYLFFNIEPVEVSVAGDSIDIEIRIYEGKQARVRDVRIIGNTKTNDHVILREIRTRPGDLFSRSDIMRTQQALAQLGFFDAQAMDVRPIPNPIDGTVDLEYVVSEAPSDQIELSGGWGAGQIVGTLGLSFNNFSLRNIFKRKAWTPLPSGDGQKLSIRAQSNGPTYQNYFFSFTEPWLGGKKPIAFSLFVSHNRYVYGGTDTATQTRLFTTSVGVSVSKQVKWPDDYFSISLALKYNHYNATKYRLFVGESDLFSGSSNNFSVTLGISRNSTDDWIFPTSGSIINASVELTPPYSIITGRDFSNAPISEKYNLLEYHKWKLKMTWFFSLAKRKSSSTNPPRLVAMLRAEAGFIGSYNPTLGSTPFERFFLGGDGLTGFNLDGREIIALRGYSNYSLTPGYTGNSSQAVGGTIYTKYTFELRYLISPNPQAKIYALAFLEAGNSWDNLKDFTPFNVNKSAGIGVRLFLPMFGLLGVDYGWGFDPIRNVAEDQRQKGMFHFMIGQQF